MLEQFPDLMAKRMRRIFLRQAHAQFLDDPFKLGICDDLFAEGRNDLGFILKISPQNIGLLKKFFTLKLKP
jgi:hypothetical protein